MEAVNQNKVKARVQPTVSNGHSSFCMRPIASRSPRRYNQQFTVYHPPGLAFLWLIGNDQPMGSTQLLAGLDNILTRVSMDLNPHDTNLGFTLLDW